MTMTMKRFAYFAFAGVLGAAVLHANRASSAEPAQRRWGSETMPNNGVCFYRDKDFKGEYFCVPAGESMSRLPGDMNDKISSFRVMGAVDVMIFKDDEFRGPSGRYSNSVRDMRREGWNDQVSSIRVSSNSGWNSASAFPSWGNDNRPQEGACFYKDVDFHGDYFCVPRGASYAKVPSGFNDAISSIRIMNAGGVTITADEEFGGSMLRFTEDVKDLRRGIWNDRISSIRVN